jgi:hypothetical protein
MIVILSANANHSVEIPKELSLASQFGIPVVPIRVEDFEFNNALRYEFATRQYIDLFPLWERGMEQLVVRLRVLTKVSIDHNQLEQLRLCRIIESVMNRQPLHRLPFDAATRLIEEIALARESATDPAPHAASLLVLRARYFVRNGVGWRGPQREELLLQATQLDTKTAIQLAKVLRITHEDFVRTIQNA